jgi:hypothetical protein
VPALPDPDDYAEQALALLCELCEQDPPVLDGAALAEQFPKLAIHEGQVWLVLVVG